MIEAIHQTWTGQGVDAVDPDPATIRLEDIAHALANKTRFNGHTQFYSVAQHCVEGSRLLPSSFKLAFLLHEVSEVYLPDVPGRLKKFVRVGLVPWSLLEDRHAWRILQALKLESLMPLLKSPEVKAMDLAMLRAEAEQLHPQPLIKQWEEITVPAANVSILPWDPARAEYEFHNTFRALTT